MWRVQGRDLQQNHICHYRLLRWAGGQMGGGAIGQMGGRACKGAVEQALHTAGVAAEGGSGGGQGAVLL